MNGIDSVKLNAAAAVIDDKTILTPVNP
jgi:uncharacterized protein YegP (UPF0339 family)